MDEAHSQHRRTPNDDEKRQPDPRADAANDHVGRDLKQCIPYPSVQSGSLAVKIRMVLTDEEDQ